MARYVHTTTTESGVVGYEVRIEKPDNRVRTHGVGLVRRPPSREPRVEVCAPDDLRRILEEK